MLSLAISFPGCVLKFAGSEALNSLTGSQGLEGIRNRVTSSRCSGNTGLTLRPGRRCGNGWIFGNVPKGTGAGDGAIAFYPDACPSKDDYCTVKSSLDESSSLVRWEESKLAYPDSRHSLCISERPLSGKDEVRTVPNGDSREQWKPTFAASPSKSWIQPVDARGWKDTFRSRNLWAEPSLVIKIFRNLWL